MLDVISDAEGGVLSNLYGPNVLYVVLGIDVSLQ